MGGGAHGFGAELRPRAFADIFEDIFGMAGAARPRQSRRARRRSALQHGDHPRRGVRGQGRAGAHPDLGVMRGLLRHRRQGRHQTENLSTLRRRRPHPSCAGLFHTGTHLHRLPGTRPGDREPVPDLLGLEPASRASVRSRSTFRPASRMAHASALRAKVRPACAAGPLVISTSSSRFRRTRSSSATALICIAACQYPWCRPRLAANSRCPPSTAPRARVKVPEGTQSGRRFRLHSKGMPVLRSRRPAGRASGGRNASEADQASA